MGQDTAIEWADHTLNVWRGCEAVSPACDHCYAEAMSKRNPFALGTWGPEGVGKRVVGAEQTWKLPEKWNKAAKAAGRRYRVFCLSLGDVFEAWTGPMLNHQGHRLWLADPEPTRWVCEPAGGLDALAPFEKENVTAGLFRPLTMADVRQRLFELIGATRHLDYLLLTKRPELAAENWPLLAGIACGGGIKAGLPLQLSTVIPNAWVGTTVEDRKHGLPRIDILRTIPAVVRFLSVEPLLEDLGTIDLTGIHWVIVGGESGHHARPMHPDWARSLRDQCQAAGVPFFFKQWGEYAGPDFLPLSSQHHEKPFHSNGDGTVSLRVGKKAAGRLLDGREWNELPVGAAP